MGTLKYNLLITVHSFSQGLGLKVFTSGTAVDKTTAWSISSTSGAFDRVTRSSAGPCGEIVLGQIVSYFCFRD